MWDFIVFKHPTLGYKAIRKGAQPFGFIFSCFWLLYQRIWNKALACFFLAIIGTITWAALFGEAGQYIISGIIALLIGFKGGEWLTESLLSRGYEQLEEIKAKSADGAIASVASKEKADA